MKRALVRGTPVISVDTKQKELIGNFANGMQQWRPAQTPTRQVHDFPTPAVPRAYPYGIYDIGRNTGFVNIGTDHDTGALLSRRSEDGGTTKAVASIRRRRRS